MSVPRIERRLSAILAADVAGYSRMMSADDAGTLAALQAHRAELIDPKIAEHNGRIVKTTGDGALVEFPSVIEAVRCAVELQRGMADRNAEIPHEKRIEFRMGINFGDVIAESGDVYGDGVNLAARLEQLADPGSICLSAKVRDEIMNRVDLPLTDLGAQRLKNIDRPVHVFRIDSLAPMRTSGLLPLPDKPSIAVLPFINMSGDREQEHFADGISEDIITALSRIRWLFVIARNSSFAYKERDTDVKRVANELGVRYVLEGSVRKTATRVRITAQLVDARSGAHHWAERYDRDVTDIFVLQDEVAQNVAAAIEPRLLLVEGSRSHNRPPADLDAWELVARAMGRFWRVTRDDVEAAVAMLREAIARYPDYGPGHSMLAFSLVLAGHFGYLPMFEVPRLAVESARRAVELDDNDPWAYLALGYVAFVARQSDDAVAQFRRAIELNPNFAAANGYLGYAQAFDGRSNEAIENLSLAMRLSPHDRQNPIFMGGTAVAHYLAKRYDQAVEWARKAVQHGPSMTAPYRILCASLAQAGRIDEARAILARARELQPHLSVAWVERMVPYTPKQLPHFVDGLRKAGLQ